MNDRQLRLCIESATTHSMINAGSSALRPLPRSISAEPIFCFYINKTNDIQLVRVSDVASQTCDRSLRPNEHLLFETSAEAILEIYSAKVNRDILWRSMNCQELAISHELIEKMLYWLC